MTTTEDNKQGQNCVLTSNHSLYLVCISLRCSFLGDSGGSGSIIKHLSSCCEPETICLKREAV